MDVREADTMARAAAVVAFYGWGLPSADRLPSGSLAA
jgi:hypothetical protein